MKGLLSAVGFGSAGFPSLICYRSLSRLRLQETSFFCLHGVGGGGDLGGLVVAVEGHHGAYSFLSERRVSAISRLCEIATSLSLIPFESLMTRRGKSTARKSLTSACRLAPSSRSKGWYE